MKRYGPLLLMLGLLLGPTYYIFCEYLSGENGDTFVLTERAARWTLPDGTILHVSNGKAFRPVTLKLDPEMNRIAFRLTFEAAPGSSDAAEGNRRISDHPSAIGPADLRARAGGQAGARRKDEASKRTDSRSTTPEPTSFSLQETGTPRVPVSQVTLEVRKKIDTLLLPLMWGGFAMLVVGLAITLEPYLPRDRLR